MGNGRKVKVEIDITLDFLGTPTSDLISANIAHKISMVQSELKVFVKTLSRYQRVAATHVWVVMISPENRQYKPYALPVQRIPYKSLTASAARSLVNKLVQEMVKKDMEVVGKCFIELLYLPII